ncbi:MAG: DUF1579 domain-containing protein [Gemmataceae bacterium]
MKRQITGAMALLVVGGLLAGGGVLAGDKEKKDDKKGFEVPPPGPEHKVLSKLTGTWEAKVKFYGPGGEGESKGTMKRAMIMGGRFLKEDFTGDMMGMKFQGMGVVGFDPAKKKYVSSWIDNMSFGITTFEGTYDAEKKTLTSVGEDVWEGKKMKARDVLTIISDKEQKFEMFRSAGEKEFKVMDITYTKAPDKKKVKKEKGE